MCVVAGSVSCVCPVTGRRGRGVVAAWSTLCVCVSFPVVFRVCVRAPEWSRAGVVAAWFPLCVCVCVSFPVVFRVSVCPGTDRLVVWCRVW